MWNAANPYCEPLQPRFVPSLLGPLTRTAAPTGTVVALADACSHLRQTEGIDDSNVTAATLAATAFCEQRIPGHRQFLTASYQVPVRTWWWDETLYLPRPPLQSVDSIQYYDTNGVLQTLDPSYYVVNTPWRAPGSIDRAPLMMFPAHEVDRHGEAKYPILVNFTCGYGAAADVPATLVAAVKLALAWLYEDRAPSDRQLAAVDALLETEFWGSYA